MYLKGLEHKVGYVTVQDDHNEQSLKFKILAQDGIPRNAVLSFTCLITSKPGKAVIFVL